MRLKLFRAAGMAEAMALVRADLGPDALILNTKTVPGGIEITAALESEQAPPPRTDPARLTGLTWHGVPRELHPALAHGDLETALAIALRFDDLALQAHAPPLLLAGSPGAGKTLTTVRLATRLVMQGIAPMVITTDGKRAGATEQLAAFTRLLGVPLLVASHPVSLARAMLQRVDGAPVLIDTAGADLSVWEVVEFMGLSIHQRSNSCQKAPCAASYGADVRAATPLSCAAQEAAGHGQMLPSSWMAKPNRRAANHWRTNIAPKSPIKAPARTSLG